MVYQDRTALLDRQQERDKLRDQVLERVRSNSIHHSLTHSALVKGGEDSGTYEEEKLKKMQVVRNVYSSMLEKKISADEDDLAELEGTFQHIKMVTGMLLTLRHTSVRST